MPNINLDDTIAAVATPPGEGGIGVIRVSGEHAISVVDGMFRKVGSGRHDVIARQGSEQCRSNLRTEAEIATSPDTSIPRAPRNDSERLNQAKSHTVHYGEILDGKGNAIDRVLVSLFRNPTSYTGEDVVEISAHGGMRILQNILDLILTCGARQAEPGEFTRRAFVNGRIDLAQAEAVLDIIQAKTDTFLQVSAHQLKGDLSTELEGIREQLMNIYVQIEAIVNFPEDDVDTDNTAVLTGISDSEKRVAALLRSSEQGRILKEGIKIAICGKANVGKSSLLNSLLKTPRAIVSDIAGTTRDTIEETAQIKGIPFQLTDTAGILEPRDLIEEEAVKRSHRVIEGADLVLFAHQTADEDTAPSAECDLKMIAFDK